MQDHTDQDGRNASQSMPQTASIKILSSLDDISPEAWDSVANPGWLQTPSGGFRRDARSQQQHELLESVSQDTESLSQIPAYNPFLSHAFLRSLEMADCACAQTGWLPRHLVLQGDGNAVLGAAPAYLKSHSQGEYVFDHGWADAFYRAGGEYYPKLQVSVPFTPATGRRFLLSPQIDQESGLQALASGLVEICKRSGASSVHATFLTPEEWEGLGAIGYLQRTDQQFHFENPGYESFDDFLGALASRKRKAIRKERAEAISAGIDIEWVTGGDLTETHWDAFYAFYMDTGSRKWGRPYLNREFFSLISERMAEQILLVMAKRNGRYIAGALNFIGSDTLFGRNWGCTENHPFLHFEVCYYQAIEFAIQRKLTRVEAGAQGAHKLARGYLPQTTYSAHWIAHPGLRDAVSDYLDRERQAIEMENAELKERAPFRKS